MKQILKKAGIAVFVLLVLAGLQQLLSPKYMGRSIEGNFIREYYEETTEHDVLILGDCEVYENISPVTLWETYGITSYIRGSANQMTAQSYYLLEDTLRYETPKAVLFNVAAMKMGTQEKEAYNRMTLEGMRWSPAKWNAILETKLPEEYLVEYIFPILRYHSRWQELKKEDFTYYFKKETASHNGYYMRCDVKAAGEFPTERRKPSYEFPEVSWEYLNKMLDLCKKNGVQLILMKAPSLYPAWPEAYEEQIKEYAAAHDLLYLNFLDTAEQIGLDFSRDTYDAGLHLNRSGAEKLSHYLGGRLKEQIGLADHRGEANLDEIWQQKLNFYNLQLEKQETELKNSGFLSQFMEEGEVQ